MRHICIGIFILASALVAAGVSRAGQDASSVQAELSQGFGLHLAKSQPTSRTIKVEFDGKTYYLVKRSIVRATDIDKAVLGKDLRTGDADIDITLNRASAKKMLAVTRKHLGQTLCATFNDLVVNCSTIYGVFGARFQVIFRDRSRAQQVYKSLTESGD